MKSKKNEVLKSRRDFFKKAAKGVLPILGFAIIASIPTFETKASTGCTSCTGICTGCQGGCTGSCRGGCSGSCFGCTGCSINCTGTSK